MTSEMAEGEPNRKELEERLRASEERFRIAEAAGGVGIFEIELNSQNWDGSPQVAQLFGLDHRRQPDQSPPGSGRSSSTMFPNWTQRSKWRSGQAPFMSSFASSPAERGLRWIAGKGQTRGRGHERSGGRSTRSPRGSSSRPVLLAINETLEARVRGGPRRSPHLELVNRTGVAVAAELDLEKLVQMVTDAGVELSHAEFGAFFYNVIRTRRSLQAVHAVGGPGRGVHRISMPRNPAIFGPTFRGRPSFLTISSPIPGTEKWSPTTGCPRSPAGAKLSGRPVMSRTGEVLGGLSLVTGSRCVHGSSGTDRGPLRLRPRSGSTTRGSLKPASAKSPRARKLKKSSRN